MKTQKIIYALFLGLGISFSSCSDDSCEEPLIEEKGLELEQYDVKIKYEKFEEGEDVEIEPNANIVSVKIVEGHGDYSTFSLNTKIATAEYNAETNSILIQGMGVGKTRVVVLDAKTQSKTIEVGVYENDKIALKDVEGDISFALKAGESLNKSYEIVGGNGKFTASSSNKEVIKAEINSGNRLQLTTPNGATEGEFIISVIDQIGFKYDVKVIIETTTIPYTDIELENLKLIDSNTFRFNNNSASYGYTFENKITEEGVNIVGVSKTDYWGKTSKAFVYFSGDRDIRMVENAEIEYSEFGGATLDGKAKLTYMNIFHKTDKHIYASFSYLDTENKLRFGYFVVDVEP